MTPLQLGMPYSRPRYYALGRRKRPGSDSCSFPMLALPSGKPFAGPPGHLLKSSRTDKEQGRVQSAEPAASHAAIAPLSQYLDRELAPDKAPAECRPCRASAGSASELEDLPVRPQEDHHASAADGLQAIAGNGHTEPRTLDSLLQKSNASPQHQDDNVHVPSSAAGNGSHSPGSSDGSTRHGQWRRMSREVEYVSHSVIHQWGQSLDIISPDSKRCNCFTKTYFRWVKASFHRIPCPRQAARSV